jgi:hypothetical protein
MLLKITKEEIHLSSKLDVITEEVAPHVIAREIFKYFIDRNGLLVDEKNMYAIIGIDHASEGTDSLKEILGKNGIAYSGVFSGGWERWWLHRLKKFAEDICGERIGNLNAEDRCTCFNKALGIKLVPAKSKWTTKTNALFSFACSSCNWPTEIEFSVIAQEKNTEQFLNRKRICFSCIESGEYKEKKLKIDESDIFISEKIESGKIKRTL